MKKATKEDGQQRLQKILSQAGVCSRRKAEEYIKSGRVRVNDKKVTLLGSKADPLRDEIRVDGQLITKNDENYYLALHKPTGVLSTVEDERGRRTVVDLVKGINSRIYPVGRLDYQSEGLILLTNDGDFSEAIIHPRSHLPRIYRVKVKGKPTKSDLARLTRGVTVERQKLTAFRAEIEKKLAQNCWLTIELHQGKNRQIRKMLAAIGFDVVRLIRLRIGTVALGELALGEWRFLKKQEVVRLLNWAKGQQHAAVGKKRKIVRER